MRASAFSRTGKRAFALLMASTVLYAPGTVFAQQAADAEDGNAIIVTAQRRAQNLQDVPISIQALGEETLQERGVANFNQYTKQLPSVSFQTSQPGATTVYMRGVASGGDGNHSGSLPSVGTYLDEAPITTIGGTLDVHIYDIARIEALSGPQGTLFGASSEAGTLRIITNKPDHTGFYGGLDVEGNSVKKGGQGGKVEGFVNAPLSDNVALRVVGFYQHDAGYIDNVPGTRSFLPQPGGFNINNSALVEKDYNDLDVYGGRAALKIDLNDDWSATASVMGQDQKSNGFFGYDPSVGDLQVQHFLPESNHDRWYQAALTVEGKIGNWDLTYSGAYMKRKINSVSDYTDYAEAYDALYASYGGLAGYFYYLDNAGNQVLPLQKIVGEDKFTKLTQELRLSSPADKPLRVVGGLFYQRQFHFISQDYQVAGLGSAVSVNGRPGTLWLTQQDRVDKDYAAFGELSYDILSNLTLTGGLRYYKYDNSLIGFFGFGRNPAGPPYNAAGSSRTGVAACYTSTGASLRDNPGGTLLPAAVAGSPCTNLADFVNGGLVPKRTKDDGFIHRLNLTWKIDPNRMVYATWSRGFRPGGINRRATLAPYDADFLTNYEVGWKTTFAGGSVRWNGAIFWQDWKSFQYSFLGQNSFTEIHNGPNARIKGIESDVTVVPAVGLTLTATAAYIDAKTRQNLCTYDDATFTCTSPGPNGQANSVLAPTGTRLPVTPKFKINASARYEFDLGTGKFHLQGVVTHQSSALSVLRASTAQGGVRLAPYTLFDFSLGMTWDKFSVEAFLENAFDKRAQVTSFAQCSVCTRDYIIPLRPQTMGLRAGYKF